METWLPGVALDVPALAPSVAAVALAIRWIRWRRAGGRPDASGWDSRYALLALLAGLGIAACLVCAVVSIGVASAPSDTAEGWACGGGDSAACGIFLPLRVAGVLLALLAILDAWLLSGCPGIRKR